MRAELSSFKESQVSIFLGHAEFARKTALGNRPKLALMEFVIEKMGSWKMSEIFSRKMSYENCIVGKCPKKSKVVGKCPKLEVGKCPRKNRKLENVLSYFFGLVTHSRHLP